MRVLRKWMVVSLVMVLGVPALAQDASKGYVLRVQGRLVFLDLGEQENVHPGDFFRVVREETIIHPVTGENLGGQVPLGTVHVVQVLPRVSTAEVVDLAGGINLETLDREARQGLIRVYPMSEETVSAPMREKVEKTMEMPGLSGPGGVGYNPDGTVMALAPGLEVRFGSRIETALPETIQELIPEDRRGVAHADSLNQPLKNINSAQEVRFSMVLPVSGRVSALAGVRFGSASVFAVGARVYPGALLGFLGEGGNPDGRVGEPVLTLMVGSGGRGARSLPQDVRRQVVADTNLVRAALGPVVPDSVVLAAAADSTALLRADAEATLKQAAERGTGLSLELSLPVASRLSLRAGYAKFGNIREVSGGLTYYMKTAGPAGPGRNPDGALGSLVVSMDGAYDTESKAKVLGLDLRYPFSAGHTFGLGFQTDLGGFSRVGVSFKSYLARF